MGVSVTGMGVNDKTHGERIPPRLLIAITSDIRLHCRMIAIQACNPDYERFVRLAPLGVVGLPLSLDPLL